MMPDTLSPRLLPPVFAVAIVLIGGQLPGEEPRSWDPAAMMQVPRIGSVQVSPDGNRVAYAVRQAVLDEGKSEYLTHIHLATTVDRASRQLTTGEKSCDDPQWSPDGEWIAFGSSRGGKRNVWLIRPTGGEARQGTDSKSDVLSFRWSPDGQSLCYVAVDPPTPDEERNLKNKDDARVVDAAIKHQRIYLVRFDSLGNADGAARVLTPGDFSVLVDSARASRPTYDWSPDGTLLVFAHTSTPHADDWGTADLSLVNVGSGAIRPFANSPAAETMPLFAPDGKSIAFAASDNPPTWAGYKTVKVRTVVGGETIALAETRDGFGRYSELIGWTADGRGLFFTELQGTSLRLLSLPLKGPPVAISQDDGMSLSGVSLNARRTHFGFAWERPDQLPTPYVAAVERFEPLVIRTAQLANDRPLGRTQVTSWKSTDGWQVEGLVTLPVSYQEGVRYPLLVVVHGGPMGAFTQTFDGSANLYPIAAFAARGYVILRANIRGSSGYGRAFRYANYGDWGGGDFRDLMSGVDHLIERGIADPDRMGIMGWSYGGFMTSWAITQTQRFRAASVGAGVTNLLSFTGTADIPGFLPDYFGGEFWNQLEPYTTHSAMFQIKGVVTPTLIQHGEKDERVPLSQGLELYNALKRQGCDTRLVIYPRTPHSIEEPRLLLDCMQRNLDWFDQQLRSQP